MTSNPDICGQYIVSSCQNQKTVIRFWHLFELKLSRMVDGSFKWVKKSAQDSQKTIKSFMDNSRILFRYSKKILMDQIRYGSLLIGLL